MARDAINEIKYVVIERELRAAIEKGVYAVGDRIPTEDVLLEQYKARWADQVSRGTVRRALTELETDGYIERFPARGTFVKRRMPLLKKQMGEIKSFSAQLAGAGLTATTTVLHVGLCPAALAQGRVLEAFDLAADAHVIEIRRVKAGNGSPFALQTVYLKEDLCADILTLPVGELDHLFDLYRTRYGRTIVTIDEKLRVARASAEEAALLQLPPGDPVVIRDRVSYSQDDAVWEVLHSVDAPSRFVYQYISASEQTRVAS